MLSPGYFNLRWSWYRPILDRGEEPVKRCAVDVRRLPIRMSGEDGKVYIPYAMHSKMTAVTDTAMRRLLDYASRYVADNERVSAHQLPNMNSVARMMMQHLRKRYPHLPSSLLHHWCADEKGGLALLQMWQSMWKQSWQQDQADQAPWISAVNILILKLIRQSIAGLPRGHETHGDHIMICVAGGLYDWALRKFLKQHIEGTVEVTRIASYESMMIPVTPMTFLYRQPNDSLLADDRFVIMAYGLEADIVPRMRMLRDKVGRKHEAGILPLLAQDRMGEHMLRRSWVRLALWDLAESTGQGVWMQWVLDAKKLDQLLAKPSLLPEAAIKLLEANRDHAVAAWILGQAKSKSSDDKPWLNDDRVLNAFRVFEEDVLVEKARRQGEKVWLDRQSQLAVQGQNSDAAFVKAWKEGLLVFFQSAEESLHSGLSLSSKQACLQVQWAEYLFEMQSKQIDFPKFLDTVFLPEVLAKIEAHENVFLDSIQASGCFIRGDLKVLMEIGSALRELLRQYYLATTETDGRGRLPVASIALTMNGDWTVVEYSQSKFGSFRMASSLALLQAQAATAHDGAVANLIKQRDQALGKKALGGVRIENLSVGESENLNVLCNQGFALTEHVLTEYCDSMRASARVKVFKFEAHQAVDIFKHFRLTTARFEFVAVYLRDASLSLFVNVGQTDLNGSLTEVFEHLEPASEAFEMIRGKYLYDWIGG
ncbi:MAG: hypothetical protein R8K49_08385 [Mariprofundaceae bacterium]